MTQELESYKNALYEQLGRVGKAISSPRRLELLSLLSQGERTVEILANEAGLTIANASQHLKVLKEARLVATEKTGLYITYRLADESVISLLGSLEQLAKNRLAEIDQVLNNYLEAHGQLESVDREELIKRIVAGNVTVIDVRPSEEFKAGHIPGAISVPLIELEGYDPQLDKTKDVVAYCRGQYCVLAVNAVEHLQHLGYRAVRLDESIQEWKARGLPIETGNDSTNGSNEKES